MLTLQRQRDLIALRINKEIVVRNAKKLEHFMRTLDTEFCIPARLHVLEAWRDALSGYSIGASPGQLCRISHLW